MRLGSDPEIFLLNPNTNEHVSVIGLINAGKHNPLQIKEMPVGFTLQEDGVALEYGIPPAATEDEFVSHIQKVMEKSREWLVVDGVPLTFSKLSCTIFPKEQMNHPLAHIFGCEPDYNAWTGKANKKPKPPHKFMRSAGGHIHVETTQDPELVTKKMDLFLSVPAVFMDNGVERKQLYGAPGAFRPKPYGVEYRTLSNFWIAPGGSEEERDKLCRWVWRQTDRALNSNVNVDEMAEPIQAAISNNDKGLAASLVNHFSLEVL